MLAGRVDRYCASHSDIARASTDRTGFHTEVQALWLRQKGRLGLERIGWVCAKT